MILNKKVIYKALIFTNFCFAYSSEPSRPYRTYKQVFNPLVVAVLENNEAEFFSLIKDTGSEAGKSYDLHQRLSFWYTLRHVAQNKRIDDFLIENGVAPLDKKPIILFAAEVIKDAESYDKIKTKAIVSDSFARSLTHRTKFERDSVYKDGHGKFPEDYSYIEKAAIAEGIINSPFPI